MEINNYNLLYSVHFPNNGIETLFHHIKKYTNNKMKSLFDSIPLCSIPFCSIVFYQSKVEVRSLPLRS